MRAWRHTVRADGGATAHLAHVALAPMGAVGLSATFLATCVDAAVLTNHFPTTVFALTTLAPVITNSAAATRSVQCHARGHSS